MEELDLKELLQVFWEKKISIILIVAIFIVIGVIYTFGFVEPEYQSVTSLLLATNSSSNSQTPSTSITTSDVTLNSNLVETYSDLVGSHSVLRTVLSNLAIDQSLEESIKKNVAVTAKDGTEVINITVTNDDPVMAQKIANEIAKVFMERIKEWYGIENLHVVDEGEVNNTPSNINHPRDIVIFGAAGFVLALLYVLIANMLDTTIKSAQDIEKIAGYTVLASIPVYDLSSDNKKRGKRGVKRY